MIDPNYIRENPEHVKKIINGGRGNPLKANVDKWLELDSERSTLIQKADELRAKRNELSQNLKGKPSEATINEAKTIKEELEQIEIMLKKVETDWQEILDWTPNIPLSEETMEFGKGEEENRIIKAWVPGKGYISEELGFATKTSPYMPERSIHWDEALTTPKHHLEIGVNLGIIDTEQAAKVSGTRFTYIFGDGALLQYALQQFMFEELLKRGFKPIIPPLMVRDRSLYGTSHFPEGRDQVYQIKGDYVEEGMELNLVGSAEPTNFSYFMDRTLDEKELPIKIFAYTPCFRSEVGSWGKDVKGIKRLHQFDKIEMNAVTTPEQSETMYDEFLSINEWVWQTLEIPYRLAQKCTSDAGYLASAHQVDPEGWLPAQKEFIELGTDTNTTDYQARRLNIKVKKGDKKVFAHTVNDTGMAMGRSIIAIIDNYQQSDGTIKVPKALQKYIGKEFIGK